MLGSSRGRPVPPHLGPPHQRPICPHLGPSVGVLSPHPGHFPGIPQQFVRTLWACRSRTAHMVTVGCSYLVRLLSLPAPSSTKGRPPNSTHT